MAEISQRSPNPLVREYHGASQAPKPVCVCVHTLIKMGHENHFRILKSHQRVITMLSFKLSSVGWVMTQTY